MTPRSKASGPGRARPKGSVDLHLWKLPRGRHGLPRELVAQSQRERLMAAIVRVSAEKGYRATSVADVLRVAGVGRESFYKHFKDKEDCFLCANDVLVAALEARVIEAYERSGTWPERVCAGLAATLEWLAANPDAAQVMMVEMGNVGPIYADRFQETFHRFTNLLQGSVGFVETPPELPNIASIAAGGIFAQIFERVRLGDAEKLPELLPQLTFELLLSYIGEDSARELAIGGGKISPT